jgi:hypothetical protein
MLGLLLAQCDILNVWMLTLVLLSDSQPKPPPKKTFLLCNVFHDLITFCTHLHRPYVSALPLHAIRETKQKKQKAKPLPPPQTLEEFVGMVDRGETRRTEFFIGDHLLPASTVGETRYVQSRGSGGSSC